MGPPSVEAVLGLGDGVVRRRADLLGQAEIENLGVPARGDEQIRGLDVAVHDALGVRRIQRVCDLNAQIEQQIEVERPAGDAVLQRGAVQKLHGDERAAFVLADFVDGADVGMVQRGGGARFAPETFQRLRVLDHIEGQEFQGDEAAQLGVFRFVDDAHSTAAEFFDDAVMAESLAKQGLGVGHPCAF